jgi:hypothetical protein
MDWDAMITDVKSSTTQDGSKKRKQQDDGAAVSEFKRLALGGARTSTRNFDSDATETTTTSNLNQSITEEDVDEALARAEGPEWSRRWLRETRCEEYWGFARYFDIADIKQQDTDFENLEDEEAEQKLKVVKRAYQSIKCDALKSAGYADVVWRLFRMQGTRGPKTQGNIEKEQRRWDKKAVKAKKRDPKELEALEEEDLGDDDMDLDDDELRVRDDMELVKHRFLDEENSDRYEDDAALRAKLQYLRRRYKRFAASDKAKPLLLENNTTYGGLAQGMLDNTLIVIDGNCVKSHQMASSEYGWVFAVDPDYEDPGPPESLASKVKHQYRGFVRVRSEHIMNEFFEARKYHALERPMEALWREAQESGDGLFVPNVTM